MGNLSRITPATLDVLEVLLDDKAEHCGLAIAKRAGLATRLPGVVLSVDYPL